MMAYEMLIRDWSSDVCSSVLFEAVDQLARDRLAVEAAHLLEISELGDFHPVAPDLPAQPPCAQCRRFPVVLDEADVVEQRVDADRGEAAQILLLQVGGRGLQDDLILVIMLEPVRVLAIDRKSTRLNSSH